MLRLPEFFDSILIQQKLKTNLRKNLGFVTITFMGASSILTRGFEQPIPRKEARRIVH